MDSDNTFLRKECGEFEVDYRLATKLKTKVFPLLEKAHKKLGYRFDKAFTEQREGAQIRLANSGFIHLILRKLNSQAFSKREQRIISLHLEYLSLVEGFFAPEVNFLVFTLAANGCDFYSRFHRKNLDRLDDIEETSLASKLEFLRKHGFKIVADKPNIKLRNSVAHLFYYIENDGTVRIGKQKITQEKYAKLYEGLRNVSIGLHLVALTYYRKFETLFQRD